METNQQRTNLRTCIQYQVLGISKIVFKLGGPRLATLLDEKLMNSAANQGWQVTIKGGRFQVFRDDLPWRIYREILQTAVKFAVNFCGKARIENLVKLITANLEKKTGVSYLETVYRLNIRY